MNENNKIRTKHIQYCLIYRELKGLKRDVSQMLIKLLKKNIINARNIFLISFLSSRQSIKGERD